MRAVGRKWSDWNPDWDEDRHGSRYTERVEFVFSVGEPSECELLEMRQELEAEIANRFPEVEVETVHTSSGRGASAEAIALVATFVSMPGAAYASWKVVSGLFRLFRSRGQHPTMSIGATRHLCLADLLQRNPDLAEEDVAEVITTEVSPPGPPGELDHTGMDMFMAVFVKTDNSCTWVYLVDSWGKILHMGQGEPLTGDLAYQNTTLSHETWWKGEHRYLAEPDGD